MKKFFRIFFLALAALVALTYATGYDYLFKAVSKTYFRGETGANINDGELFSSNKIASTQPRPWPKDSMYNKQTLSAALADNLTKTNTAAFLVVKNGKLLHEEYWGGYSENRATNSFSMAKAVTVLLLGKAIEEGKIKSDTQLFSDFFPNFKETEGKSLTLENLAKMESGLDWDENYKNPFLRTAAAYYGPYVAKTVFTADFKQKPGTAFEYQSGSTQLLGFAVRNATGSSLANYATHKIWKPLGMTNTAQWTTDDFGVEKAFCCIHSVPKVFAKLGQLFLDNGKVDSLQYFNPEFIEKMRTPTALSKGAYGMGLWINNDAPVKHYYFWGLYGQYIIVVPEKQMVIVRTGSYKDQPEDAKGRPQQVEFIVNESVKNF